MSELGILASYGFMLIKMVLIIIMLITQTVLVGIIS